MNLEFNNLLWSKRKLIHSKYVITDNLTTIFYILLFYLNKKILKIIYTSHELKLFLE